MGEKNKQEILRLVDVHYQYDDGNVALSGIHTQFFKNEKVAVLGNNGAGKSTLLNRLLFLIRRWFGIRINRGWKLVRDGLTPVQ